MTRKRPPADSSNPAAHDQRGGSGSAASTPTAAPPRRAKKSDPAVDLASFAREQSPSSRRFSTDAPTVAPPPRSSEVEIEITDEMPLDMRPPSTREPMPTLTDEAELEAARVRSAMGTIPPQTTPLPILSLANERAPSAPPPSRPQSSSSFDDFDIEVTEVPTAPPPPEVVEVIAKERGPEPMVEMRERLALGDYTGALQVAERILHEHPGSLEAVSCAEQCRAVLIKMYQARLGPLDRVPVIMVAKNELRWLSIDHRAGFVLSHVDGISSLEMILDVSGMAPLDCLRILHELVQQRIVGFR